MNKRYLRAALVILLVTCAYARRATAYPDVVQNAAIRDCNNYVAWDPEYKSSVTACFTYCGDNDADACEYNTGNGDCYVEFGLGCRIETGYNGWWAKTFNDFFMIQDKARGGCSLTEWSPTYKANSNSCYSYCSDNDADFCEWYGGSGDCYAEFGDASSCYLAGAFGWWAAGF